MRTLKRAVLVCAAALTVSMSGAQAAPISLELTYTGSLGNTALVNLEIDDAIFALSSPSAGMDAATAGITSFEVTISTPSAVLVRSSDLLGLTVFTTWFVPVDPTQNLVGQFLFDGITFDYRSMFGAPLVLQRSLPNMFIGGSIAERFTLASTRQVVAPVPLPASISMLLAALGGLALWRRRSMRRT